MDNEWARGSRGENPELRGEGTGLPTRLFKMTELALARSQAIEVGSRIEQEITAGKYSKEVEFKFLKRVFIDPKDRHLILVNQHDQPRLEAVLRQLIDGFARSVGQRNRQDITASDLAQLDQYLDELPEEINETTYHPESGRAIWRLVKNMRKLDIDLGEVMPSSAEVIPNDSVRWTEEDIVSFLTAKEVTPDNPEKVMDNVKEYLKSFYRHHKDKIDILSVSQIGFLLYTSFATYIDSCHDDLLLHQHDPNDAIAQQKLGLGGLTFRQIADIFETDRRAIAERSGRFRLLIRRRAETLEYNFIVVTKLKSEIFEQIQKDYGNKIFEYIRREVKSQGKAESFTEQTLEEVAMRIRSGGIDYRRPDFFTRCIVIADEIMASHTKSNCLKAAAAFYQTRLGNVT